MRKQLLEREHEMARDLVGPEVVDVAVRVNTLQGHGHDQTVPVKRIPDRHAAERELKGLGNGLGGFGKRDDRRGRQALGGAVAGLGGDEQEPVSPGAAGAAGAMTREAKCRDEVDLVDFGHRQMQPAVDRGERSPLGTHERQHLSGRQAEDFVEDAGQRERQSDGDPDQQHGGSDERNTVPPPQARVGVRHRPLHATHASVSIAIL